MANFSSYASKFLNQSLRPNASVMSNDPLFYSMAEGSNEGDLDEEDPHLQQSRGKGQGQDYDPFNLEDIPDAERDEEVPEGALSLGDTHDSLPLLLQSQWHRSQQPPRNTRPQSPLSESPSNDSMDSLPLGLDTLEDDRPQHAALTQSLLPRDEGAPFVFSLPKPGRMSRSKYNDAGWATFWRVCLGVCGIGSIITFFVPSVRFILFNFDCTCANYILVETRTSTGAAAVLHLATHHPSNHTIHDHRGIIFIFTYRASQNCR